MKRWTQSFVRALMVACMWLMGLGLLGTTGVALWIGTEDLFAPVSIAGQLLGLVFFLAGLTGLAGVAGLASLAGFVNLAGLVTDRGFSGQAERRKVATGTGRASAKKRVPWRRERDQSATWQIAGVFNGKASAKKRVAWRGKRDQPPTWQIACVFSGAVAGCYIDVTIILYSLGYRITVFRIFGFPITITRIFIVLAFLCFYLGCVMLPALSVVWKYITRGIRGLGLSAALIGLIAQFWYLSIYTPDNTPVGIAYTITAGNMIGKGDNRSVQVDLAMENVGSVAAVVLNSMIIVDGISYPSGTPVTTGVQPGVIQAFSDGGFLFPDDTVQFDFVIKITNREINALKFKLIVDFARTSWLTIGKYRDSYYYVNHCQRNTSDTQKQWYIAETHLHYFARGAVVLYSDYCEYPTTSGAAPFIYVGVDGLRGGNLVSIPNQSPVGSDLGIIQSVRNESIILG